MTAGVVESSCHEIVRVREGGSTDGEPLALVRGRDEVFHPPLHDVDVAPFERLLQSKVVTTTGQECDRRPEDGKRQDKVGKLCSVLRSQLSGKHMGQTRPILQQEDPDSNE